MGILMRPPPRVRTEGSAPRRFRSPAGRRRKPALLPRLVVVAAATPVDPSFQGSGRGPGV
jgi:hypothetical protein